MQAENKMTEEKLQIEFLKELIKNSPNNSRMNINVFYSEHISEKSFRKLFSETQVPDKSKISNYIIPLTSELKNIFKNGLAHIKNQIFHQKHVLLPL